MPKLQLPLHRGREPQGVLEWDAEAGTFSGYGAADVDACADFPPAHPGFPVIRDTPRSNAASLGVLLFVLGWEIPAELIDEVRREYPPEEGAPGTVY